MTKVFLAVLLVGLVLVVLVGLAFLVLQVLRSSGRLSFATSGSPAYRNHLAMARWIERQLEDDLVRVSIQPGEQAEARALLNDFYDERREIGGGD